MFAEPKLTTKELSAEVGNLTYCSQYIFAVGVVSANSKIAHPPRNIRTIGTLIDPLSPPENLQVDFLPAAHPCLLITWSASCPNIAVPVGYSVSAPSPLPTSSGRFQVTVSERSPARMTIITEPRSASAELAQTLRVVHGKSYDIKVATDAVGAVSTATVPFTVPHFLQPYKVRLTSRPEGTFIVYWREPYVPYYVGDFYYEVYVYPGRSLASKPEIFPTTKPVFIHKGNLTEYTFMVGLRSEDGVFESHLTDPLVQNLDGQVSTLNIS
ncbi:hypothetical protein BDFB_013980 [Asbolus verrucosus]|uniref:Fibronectin type-III domain-containing protein n=1 Tax=Asbolus verrucosus TaxID=1661398 RepID=A0A482VUZ9_ASBVE|nr:hypothetical protein BDFB_013980 [Asbolus verrucosus]